MIRSIGDDKKYLIEKLYYKNKFSMSEISRNLNVSLDATVSFFRRHNIKRRNRKEAQFEKFQKKEATFKKRKINTDKLKELSVIGAMLYWGEGYKGNHRLPAHGVDFANSDQKMILLFLKFLRSVFILDESRFRIYLYCYSDQNIKEIVKFWSRQAGIPKKQFTKPYVRNDFRDKANKMPYGLIHIRYHDKKLLLEIKNMIESYVTKYASVV